MKKLSSIESAKNQFKEQMLKKIKRDEPNLIHNGNFKLSIDYYLDKLSDLDNECILGLSKKETLVLRYVYGFNKDMVVYNYKEINNYFNIRNSRELYLRILFTFTKITRSIRRILEKEKKYKKEYDRILLGMFELPTQTFNILQYHEIYTIGDLLRYSKEDLLKLPKMGENIVKILEEIIGNLGLKFPETSYIDNKENDLECDNETRKIRRELKLKILGLEYQKVLLQYERIYEEKREIEEQMKNLLIENANDFDFSNNIR